MTLYAAMYLSVMGTEGLREVNELSYAGAHYLAEELVKTGNVELRYPQLPFLNEFVIKCTKASADDILLTAEAQGILAGVKIADDELMLAVTEMRSREEIDKLVSIVSLLGSDE
jgi:glycine dehydrogenase subunit 1